MFHVHLYAKSIVTQKNKEKSQSYISHDIDMSSKYHNLKNYVASPSKRHTNFRNGEAAIRFVYVFVILIYVSTFLASFGFNTPFQRLDRSIMQIVKVVILDFGLVLSV